jgi:acyl-CoA thioesterase FadM
MTEPDAGTAELQRDGYRVIAPVEPAPSDFDRQGHLNNAATVRLFNDMRVRYVHGEVGGWWTDALRDNQLVIAARELHVLYESEGMPGDRLVGGMKYVGREGKAAILEQRIVEASAGRAIARLWAVQLVVHDGTVVAWPARYFERVREIEGCEIPVRPRSAARPWGPPAARSESGVA